MLSQKNKFSGFTLIEILIALFIFTIIFMLMLNALRMVINESTRAHEKAIYFHELNLGLLFLDRDIQQMVVRPVLDKNNLTIAALVGEPSQLEFTTRGDQQLKRVQYSVKDANLQRLTWEVLDRAPNSPPPLSRKLLPEVVSIKFEYINDIGNFISNWPQSNAVDEERVLVLPQAIRITLNLKKWGRVSRIYLLNAKSVSHAPPH